MSTVTRFGVTRVLFKLIAIVLCALCLQVFSGCAGGSGDEWAVNQAIKYAHARTQLDMARSSVIWELPDATVEVSLLNFKDTPSGTKEIELEPSVVSDTMASWGADEWAENRDDLFFNLGAHFVVVCKQAHEFGDIPEGYEVTCPEYMVVYDSKRSTGFIVDSTGVYLKTEDPENPIGEAVVLTAKK